MTIVTDALIDTAAGASSTFYRFVDVNRPLADESPEDLERIAHDIQRRANRSRNASVTAADKQHVQDTPFQPVNNVPLTPSALRRSEVLRADQEHFRTGDRVKVVLGTFIGQVGRIAFVNDDNTAAVDLNVASPNLNDPEMVKRLDIPTEEMRKCFLPGDFVVIMLGKHKGVQGFIVQIDERSVAIYQRDPRSQSRMLSDEVGNEV